MNSARQWRAVARVLDRAEMPVDTVELARFLIGKMLVRTLPEGVAGGRIVETEAYGIGDPAGHAYRGITPRNRALFLERGHAYVYLAYGISFMLNVSSEAPGVGAGVLIRAIEPTYGITIMERNRGIDRVRDLARGPDGYARPWGLIAGWTGSTSVRPARCGSDLTVRRPTRSGRAKGSALRAQPTACCDSTFGAIGSSAVRGLSTDERSNFAGRGPSMPASAGHSRTTLTLLRAISPIRHRGGGRRGSIRLRWPRSRCHRRHVPRLRTSRNSSSRAVPLLEGLATVELPRRASTSCRSPPRQVALRRRATARNIDRCWAATASARPPQPTLRSRRRV